MTNAASLYIDLLIKCITNTIYGDVNMGPFQVPGYSPEIRRQGADWPEVAHTMIGVLRMENVRELTETVLREKIPGDLIEAGVWRGGACILMRGILKAYGETNRKIYVCDSFQGLPPPDEGHYPADAGQMIHTEKFLAVSQETVAGNFRSYGLLDEQVEFMEGWFKDTLPHVPSQQFALIRLDGDLYESTAESLVALYPKLSIGGYAIIDDYFSWVTCRQAVDDFRRVHGIKDEIFKVDTAGAYWRRTK